MGCGKHPGMHGARQRRGWAMTLATALVLLAAGCAGPSGGRIAKVLPHWLDREGRHALAPSLFERDAYQHHLRTHPEERGGL
ncbi:MAG: hypothetical protein D6766_14185, partial [Verrucomicrobia bacterium]